MSKRRHCLVEDAPVELWLPECESCMVKDIHGACAAFEAPLQGWTRCPGYDDNEMWLVELHAKTHEYEINKLEECDMKGYGLLQCKGCVNTRGRQCLPFTGPVLVHGRCPASLDSKDKLRRLEAALDAYQQRKVG